MDCLFYTRSHVAVLRVLTYHTKGISRRDAARATRLSHQACTEALARLETTGILRRVHRGRKLALDMDHPLVEEVLLPLFALEESFEVRLFPGIRR